MTRNAAIALVMLGILGVACRSEEPKPATQTAAREEPANPPSSPAVEVSPSPPEPVAVPTPEPPTSEATDKKERLAETYSALFCATLADESADLAVVLAGHGYDRLSTWSKDWDREAQSDPDWARSLVERVTPNACR